MSETIPRPEPASSADGVVADAVRGNWVDRLAPPRARPWLRMARADRPAGTWLLFIPCLWGLLLSAAAQGRLGWDGAWIALGCGIGAFLMRGAGCTWNDITDRHIDGSVARTRSRPIPSGQVTVRGAAIWMALQALVAFAILLTFNLNAILLGLLSLAPVCVYPFAKRFTWWPQVFLGLAFNWGALLAWTAHQGSLGWPAVCLYLGGIAWTIFYDTIYAHQDREDDALIGVKSTARLFGRQTRAWLALFGALVLLLLLAAVEMALGGAGRPAALWLARGGAAAMGLHLAWQWWRLDIDDTDLCLALFRANRDAGLIFAAFLCAGAAF
ncbi:4-hydroxybenzoate octaprenyltransferase [Mangrovicoccus algicola]|uniref:4-hydroxybenzoate octaprenyltransferase n=1 Tax=Mangrovicoccus algicola TaxID=2771008 RepID=A0A8J7CWQ9_9RHOB|nr:4-hydroxybenzoate octaprenyltransferase [Mangrovicoccus algicola]MBE3638067.1 4-hydroxybenzoate octaprenyltransferase [Mangrovicoccus algicola]